MSSYDDFFRSATSDHDPYPYQARLACGKNYAKNPLQQLKEGQA